MTCLPKRTMIPLLLVLILAGSASDLAAARFQYARPKMGSMLRIVVYAADRDTADRAVGVAYARVDQLNAILSDYDPQSELSQLSARSRHAAPTAAVHVSDDLLAVLSRAEDLSKMTDGAFDVTVGPYVRLWRRARQQRILPSAKRLAATCQSVGFQNVRIDRQQHTVTLLAPRMRLDLGGIAKGYVVDQALRALAAEGVTRALVDAGGDVAVGAAPDDRPGWHVGLVPYAEKDPGKRQTIRLVHQAAATSGDTYRYVELDGIRYSHIIDPRTGIGLTRPLIVTVCAADCARADSLASAVSVLGLERGMELIRSLTGVSVRICDLDADPPKVYLSADFPARIRQPCRANGAERTKGGLGNLGD
jgi:thiamine biosynthesis lipoprotein